ncbi:MAG: PTS glucose transporter subunit IIA [Lachnospiraceae bacterium]|nr:PTS glucose transporter subunit IIA [Lachnospiraceae bacterium]
MKDKVFGILQRVGRSFMLPIAILPVAGLLLGIGGSLSNQTMLATYGLEEIMGPGTILNGIFLVMRDAGDIIFANLPIIFAIGVAIGMAKREKEVAALAAVIAFFIMHASISAMIEINGGTDNLLSGAATSVVGITSLQMGVFGGIIVGLGVALLHNRFYKIELPQVLSFFGGTRFVPIVCALVYTAVGILMYFVWPPIQNGIYAVGDVVLNSGYFGTWVYGLMERLLIPFGLHHVFYLPFWQTAVGGTMEVAGRVVEGAQNIFFAQLADPTVERFAVSATRFMSGKFPLMIFGLPGAALAMYKMSKSENKKKVGGLLLSAALTSMLTGITEPLEFTFLFVAPILYAIHCVFAGLAYMLMHLFEVGVGMTFSGGLIDMFLFGILQGNEKTNWIWIVIVGVFYFIVYYFVFSFLIKRLDLKTPGRGDEEVKLYTRKDVQVGTAKQEKGNSEKNEDEISINICKGLGGKKNISDIDCCATRLRCTVYDKELVNDAILRSTGASGVVHKGQGVQIIYGPRVTVIKSNLEAYMESSEEDTVETKKRLINKRDIFSPVTGRVIGLEEVSDEAFASGALGQGIAIEPEEEYIKAPEDGEVTMIFDTKHAIGFLTNTGIYILIHVGIDTVKLNGKGFENLVNIGDKVKKGTPLMKFDLDYIKKEAVSAVTPIICTELTENQSVEIEATEYVKAEDKLYSVLDYE